MGSRKHIAITLSLFVVLSLTLTGSAFATPTEPIDTVSDAAWDTIMADTNQPNTFNWANPTTLEKARARTAFWRARMAGRYLPTITKTGRWLVPQLSDRTACVSGVLVLCAVGAFDTGWIIGATINKAFLGRWNGGYSCMTPFGCSASTGKPTTPTGDTDFTGAYWSEDPNGTSVSSWIDVDGAPYPCGIGSGTFYTGCATNNVDLTLTFATGWYNSAAATSIQRFANTDRCGTFAIDSTLTSAHYDYLGNDTWYCSYKTQTAVNDAVYAWNLLKGYAGDGTDKTSASSPPPAHLFQVRPGKTTTNIAEYNVYMTPAEFEERMSDIQPGTLDGRATFNQGSYTPPSPTGTDRTNTKNLLKDGKHKSGRRAADCAIDPTSTWCIDGSPGDTDSPAGTDPPPTTSGGTTNVFVTNFPGTTTVVGTVGVTGTVNTFTPQYIPRPDINETYQDYADRLRATGWLGTLILDGTETGPSGLSGYGPNAVTRLSIDLGSYVDPAAWPLVPPILSSPSVTVHIRVNPGTAPPAGGSSTCGPTPPAVNLAPITSIPFGTKFPFGIFGFLATALAPLVASPETPIFDVPISLPGGILGSDSSGNLHVDLSPLNPYMSMMRLLMAIGIGIAAIYLLASSLLGFRAGNAGGGLDMGAELGDE